MNFNSSYTIINEYNLEFIMALKSLLGYVGNIISNSALFSYLDFAIISIVEQTEENYVF